MPHPTYSPDLALSDYHLFGKLKDGINGTMFKDGTSLLTVVKQWSQYAGPESYHEGIQALVPRWHKVGQQKNSIMFLKDVCVLCTSKSAVEQILICSKIVGLYFWSDPRTLAFHGSTDVQDVAQANTQFLVNTNNATCLAHILIIRYTTRVNILYVHMYVLPWATVNVCAHTHWQLPTHIHIFT